VRAVRPELSDHFGLIELILVFGAALSLGIFELIRSGRSRVDRSPPDPSRPRKQKPPSRNPPKA